MHDIVTYIGHSIQHGDGDSFFVAVFFDKVLVIAHPRIRGLQILCPEGSL
jgi:hypothetical protein